MDDPKPWLTLARAQSLHAGHLRRPDGSSLDPLALLRDRAAALAELGLGEAAIEALRNPAAEALAADERWLAGPGGSS